jgi:hypothetical protein
MLPNIAGPEHAQAMISRRIKDKYRFDMRVSARQMVWRGLLISCHWLSL